MHWTYCARGERASRFSFLNWGPPLTANIESYMLLMEAYKLLMDAYFYMLYIRHHTSDAQGVCVGGMFCRVLSRF